MFTAITLSTGKTINIPIFDAYGDAYSTKSRANAVLRDYDRTRTLVYSRVSDDELLELALKLTQFSNGTSMSVRFQQYEAGNTYDGHWVMFLFWYYNPIHNKYELAHPFQRLSGPSLFALAALIGDSHYSGILYNYRYYRDRNLAGYLNQTYFVDAISYVREHPDVRLSHPLLNVRPGGYYTLDLFFKNDDTYNLVSGLIEGSPDEQTVYANIEAYEQRTGEDVDVTDASGSYTDPYGNIISEPGGGDGDPSVDPSAIDKATIPPLPSLSAVDAGMITMYMCTNAQLQALAAYLWANIYDLETNFVKLFSNPMDCIIGLGIVPVLPQLGSASYVKFGNITTTVSMTKLASQFQEFDCGTVSVPKWIGCFLDYAPYVKLSIYLPYIGYRDLSADDVVGDTLHVVYHIDCLTGGCCAMIETGRKGLLYSFNGSCIADVPLTAINYSGAIQNAVSAVGAGLTMAAGVATGAAPLTAMGATQMLSSAANTALNSKPSVQRSGSMGGAAGLMSNQKPMLIIERPRMAVPNNLNKFIGNTLYVTRKLNAVKGFTTVEHINLDGVPAMKEEREELTRILKEGVIF